MSDTDPQKTGANRESTPVVKADDSRRGDGVADPHSGGIAAPGCKTVPASLRDDEMATAVVAAPAAEHRLRRRDRTARRLTRKPSSWSIVWLVVGLAFIVLCVFVPPLGGLRVPGVVAGGILLVLGLVMALWPQKPETLPPESEDPLVNAIRHACYRFSVEANTNRDQRTGYAVFAAILGPLAVAMLAYQLLSYPNGGVEAIVLIGTELTVLLLALSTGFMRLGTSHQHWIKARLRAELMRREEFLYRGQVGPYLGCDHEQLQMAVDSRIKQIEAEKSPETFIALEDDSGKSWLHHLEYGEHKALSKADGFLKSYVAERIDHQIGFYVRQSEKHERLDTLYENLARASLGLGLAVAAFHLGVLAAR